MSKRKKTKKSHRHYNNKVINNLHLLDILKQCRRSDCCPLRKTACSLTKQNKINDSIEIFGSIDSFEYELLKKGDMLFKKPSNYSNLSIINRNDGSNNFLLPKGYYDIVIDGLKKIRETQDNSVKDSLIYPVLYNFRHYLEIIMKDTVRNFKIAHNEITSQQVGYEDEHSLLKIWNKLKSYLSSSDVETDECKAFEVLINEINRIDDQSFSFRYSYKGAKTIDDTREPIFNNCIDIDVENLEKVIKRMHRFIEGISDLAYNQCNQ